MILVQFGERNLIEELEFNNHLKLQLSSDFSPYKWSDFRELLIFISSCNLSEHFMILNSDEIKYPLKFKNFVDNLLELNIENMDLMQIHRTKLRNGIVRPVFDSYRWFNDLTQYLPAFLVRREQIFNFWIRFTRSFFYYSFAFWYKMDKIAPNKLTKKIVNRISQFLPIRISLHDRHLRRNFKVGSPFIFHSFESGLECFIISKRLATHLLTVNNPAFLSSNLLLSAVARTQNLYSLRLLRNPF